MQLYFAQENHFTDWNLAEGKACYQLLMSYSLGIERQLLLDAAGNPFSESELEQIISMYDGTHLMCMWVY